MSRKMKSAVTALLLITLVVAVAAQDGCIYSGYRLPQRIRPEHYDLRLDVDTDNFTYEGKVRIILRANNTKSGLEDHNVPPNVIVLHANSTLTIDEVLFRPWESSTNRVESVCRDEHNELLVVSLKEQLAHQDKGELVISFHAAISDDPDYLMGFYKKEYKTDNGRTEAIVSTQFEAAAARQAFPCFDEPSFKADFDITLVHDPQLVALANTAVKWQGEHPKTGRQVTTFKRTPPMSTYLVAFVIGDLVYIEQVIFDGRLRLRAYTLPGKTEQARFALETAVRVLPMMEEYFDVPFVMEKIDMVGLPDLANAAMENWGLIFYAKHIFLYDKINSQSREKGLIATTVVHELAHQWFGNLVTMNWWNDLWLNEGFASWMQAHFTSLLYPEMEWDYYCLRAGHIVYQNSDAQPDTHPIQLETVGRNLDELFDGIVYKKTEAVLKHIHDDYLGPELFREGIRRYIKKHLYGNTEASDLWTALKEASGLPVDELIKSWITQPGHPEIEAELAQKDGKQSLHLTQRRHFSTDALDEEQVRAAAEQKWIIPISLIVADDKGNKNLVKLVMDDRQTQVELPGWFDAKNGGHWVKLNAGFKGFYRVRYSRDLVMRLEKPCKSKALETRDRLNVIYDVFTLKLQKSLSDADLANVLGWFVGDEEGSIISSQSEALERLAESNLDANFLSVIRSVILDSYKAIYERRGFRIEYDEPSWTDTEGLVLAFSTLFDSGFTPVVRSALMEFNRNGNRANAHLRLIIYRAVVKFGTQDQVARLKSYLRRTEHWCERWRILIAFNEGA